MELPRKFQNMQGTTELPIAEVVNREEARLIDKKEFDRKKESTLCTYNHRFLCSEDPGWELLKEKLIHMHQVYGKKKSVHAGRNGKCRHFVYRRAEKTCIFRKIFS